MTNTPDRFVVVPHTDEISIYTEDRYVVIHSECGFDEDERTVHIPVEFARAVAEGIIAKAEEFAVATRARHAPPWLISHEGPRPEGETETRVPGYTNGQG